MSRFTDSTRYSKLRLSIMGNLLKGVTELFANARCPGITSSLAYRLDRVPSHLSTSIDPLDGVDRSRSTVRDSSSMLAFVRRVVRGFTTLRFPRVFS
jgi:hypothetical protein